MQPSTEKDTNKEVEAISFACEQIRNEIEGCWEEDFVEYAGKILETLEKLVVKIKKSDTKRKQKTKIKSE